MAKESDFELRCLGLEVGTVSQNNQLLMQCVKLYNNIDKILNYSCNMQIYTIV